MASVLEGARQQQRLSLLVAKGILRAGGRFRNAVLLFEGKLPVPLPYQHPVTDLVIAHHHVNESHMGVGQCLAAVNHSYWIEKGRSAVKKVVDCCVSCCFRKVDVGRQQMADLPAHRVAKLPLFEIIGTDLMGSLIMTNGRSRIKRYVCIFN